MQTRVEVEEKIIEEMKNRFPGVDMECVEVNGTRRLSCRRKGEAMGTLARIPEDMEDVDAICDILEMAINEGMRNIDGDFGKKALTMADRISKWDKVQQDVIPVLMRGNDKRLDDLAHKMMGDIACAYQVYICVDGMEASIKITNNVLKNWGITLEELHEKAVENIDSVMKPRVIRMSDCMREMIDRNDLIENEEEMIEAMDNLDDSERILVVDAQFGKSGAAILSREVQKTVSIELGSKDWYVIPSSVYEVMAVRATREEDEKESYRRMIREVNQDMEANEILSYELCEIRDGELHIVEEE